MTAHILLVDDDTIAQDLLKGLLQTRGYTVDTAEDGFAALRMLRMQRYDLAMIDYHMPDLDGYASARLLRDVATGLAAPKLVAVTGDNQTLAARPGANGVFDAILPKAVEPQHLFRSIEQLLHDPQRVEAIEAAVSAWRLRGLRSRPKVLPVPEPRLEQALAIDTCFEAAEPATADMIGLLDDGSAQALHEWRAHASNFLVPIVDLTGSNTPGCDVAFNAHDPQSWTAVASVVSRFATRRAHLRPSVREGADLDLRLLAYVYVSDRPMKPIADPKSRLFVQYPGFFSVAELRDGAERLTRKGLLQRTFVDRYHACPACRSHRLNVREECLSCRSPDLHEVALIHHFRCAEIAPEAAFRSGMSLVCPKCRQHLRHYGTDYEKPGTVLRCAACETTNSEPSVGFVCQDCDSHTDGEAAPTNDVFAYALTEQAIKLLVGQDQLVDGPRLPRPAKVQAELIQLAADMKDAATTMACISYSRREAVITRRGEGAFAKLRALFVENLRNTIAEIGVVVAEGDKDFLLLKETEQQEVIRLWPSMIAQCEATMAESLGPNLVVIAEQGSSAA